MNTIPDEVLTNIFLHVPCIRKQFHRLALVNNRFKNVVCSGMIRAHAAHTRFPDFARLLDCRSLSAEELAHIAWKEARIEELLDYAIDGDEDDNTRRMVRVGIILLEYITTLNTTNSRDNSLYLEWLKMNIFTEDMVGILRYSLCRIFDGLDRDDDLFWINVGGVYGGRTDRLLAALLDSNPGEQYNLNNLLMRSFESLVLSRTDGVSLLQSIFSNGRLDLTIDAVDDAEYRGRRTLTRLAKSYTHASVQTARFNFSEKDYPDLLNCMEAFDWRPLDKIGEPVSSRQGTLDEMKYAVRGAAVSSMQRDRYYDLEMTQTAGPWEWMLEIMELDLKAIGKAMRTFRASVESGNVPQAVVEKANRIAPAGLAASLRKLNFHI